MAQVEAMTLQAPQPPQPPQPTTCSICIGTFNMTVRKKVTCDNCEADICSKCIKRYLADTVQEPNCMNCHQLYTKEFLTTNFTKTYQRTALRKVRETRLVEREKQHLPELQHRADALRNYNTLRKELSTYYSEMSKHKEIVSLLKATERTLKQLLDKPQLAEIEHIEKKESVIQQLENTTARIAEKDYAIDVLHKQINAIYDKQEKFYNIFKNGGTIAVARVQPCIIEGCKGFIGNDNACGLCKVVVCPHCLLENVDGHECKQEDIDTVKAIKEETRPCPSCQTPIFKTDGCDQMWCTQCHTTFSWNTGRIERGHVHNPHYIQWMRNKQNTMPREVGDVPCGGLPPLKHIQDKLQDLQVPTVYIVYLTLIYKMAQYIETKEMPRYPVHAGRDDSINIISIRYLADELSERRWITSLFQIEQTREINRENRLLLDMILAVIIDYFHNITVHDTKEQVMQTIDEIEEMRKYYNNTTKNLNASFDTTRFKAISIDWQKFE